MATDSPMMVAFDQALPADVDRTQLLGGKGANLAEMTRVLSLHVPPGFTITTHVCRRFLQEGWPAELDGALAEHLERLGQRLGRQLGSPTAPLLVAVRSGAPVSMPGMMDTLLNVGITPAVRNALAAAYTPAFAADTWLRFCRRYAEIVLDVPRPEVADVAIHDGTPEGILLAAQRLWSLAAAYGGIPEAPLDQVRGAVVAVFRSWQSARARAFRRRESLPEFPGTAVTIQAMVFGNLGRRAGTGVAFTRNPVTGDPGPYGDYLIGAQGEDVVAGTHAVAGLDALRQSVPAAYDELLEVLDRLERHYRDMCDVEFTVSDGTLYILQARIGRRSPLAALRIAVAMAEDPEFPLTREEAVARTDVSTLQQLSSRRSVRADASRLARGLAASPGIGVGVLCCDPDRAADMISRGFAVVLARQETSPADIHGMIGAAGLITTLGGVASHAAVVARSWALPAVTSLEHTTVLAAGIETENGFVAAGELVTVDGSSGAVYLGDQRTGDASEHADVAIIRSWASELGVEPGSMITASGRAHRSAEVPLFILARVVQLKGLCTVERAATALDAAEFHIAQLIAANDALFQVTPRGIMLTPDGRSWVSKTLHEERAATDVAEMERSYAHFVDLNQRFKQIVSDWQMAAAGETDSSGWDAVVESVSQVQSRLQPILERNSTLVPRLGSYARRFAAALDAMRSGERSMLAAPLKESYHTVWFEYHEELMALCGRDRASEERQAP